MKVDVWRGYVFAPARLLLDSPHGDIAAMTILCGYFEAIASYTSGEDSNGKSRHFFTDGICQVFQSQAVGIQEAARAIYKHIRRGLAHEGMLSHKVNYSRIRPEVFLFSYRKKADDSLNTGGEVASIVINPLRVFEPAEQHFTAYVLRLRTADDPSLCEAFRTAVTRQWALGAEENVIGMTEAEFLAGTSTSR